MSRVPINIKKEFINLANAEFCSDYGLCFSFIFNQAIEYQSMKALFFDKLQNMEDKIDTLIDSLSNKHEENTEHKVVKTFSGRRIEIKGGKK